ncbi:hypothetical protein TIFTF001_048937 [Ficus carica]|uniref:Uncharacterized protein n=1 Tax=Ficus carica TaxID=3494 RepID=A0AA87Z0W7_FICCA|nr:hypothetical protein TIFTF001_048931 [Ficus carica]GMN21817.1 hypothetical protein TIFTF001_048933 [Ficus carica]GMN21838.1 hypothetical protein TIFTF001_048936 [Ficus carica]GMN21847.1 hypothetical protein TIFTF001_048937 [Ficus carica]
MKVEVQGFGLGSGEKEPPVAGSLTGGRDQRYEVAIGTLEAGEGGGTSWLGIGQKRNSDSWISYARTSIRAKRQRGTSLELVETAHEGGTVVVLLELVVV